MHRPTRNSAQSEFWCRNDGACLALTPTGWPIRAIMLQTWKDRNLGSSTIVSACSGVSRPGAPCGLLEIGLAHCVPLHRGAVDPAAPGQDQRLALGQPGREPPTRGGQRAQPVQDQEHGGPQQGAEQGRVAGERPAEVLERRDNRHHDVERRLALERAPAHRGAPGPSRSRRRAPRAPPSATRQPGLWRRRGTSRSASAPPDKGNGSWPAGFDPPGPPPTRCPALTPWPICWHGLSSLPAWRPSSWAWRRRSCSAWPGPPRGGGPGRRPTASCARTSAAASYWVWNSWSAGADIITTITAPLTFASVGLLAASSRSAPS